MSFFLFLINIEWALNIELDLIPPFVPRIITVIAGLSLSGCDWRGHRVGAGCHPFSDGVCHAATRSDRRGAAALQPGHQAQVSAGFITFNVLPKADEQI